MALVLNTQSNADGVSNIATGHVTTDSGTAVDTTFGLGFTPRKVVFINLTDRITDEWYEGMVSGASLHTIAAGTRTYVSTGGITIGDKSFTIPAALILASKEFAWEALG